MTFVYRNLNNVKKNCFFFCFKITPRDMIVLSRVKKKLSIATTIGTLISSARWWMITTRQQRNNFKNRLFWHWIGAKFNPTNCLQVSPSAPWLVCTWNYCVVCITLKIDSLKRYYYVKQMCSSSESHVVSLYAKFWFTFYWSKNKFYW